MKFCQMLKFEAQRLWCTLYVYFSWPLTKIKVNTGGECRIHVRLRMHTNIYAHLSLPIILPMGEMDS